MTEKEWHNSTSLYDMTTFLLSRASRRKLRLMELAFCRRVWHLLSDKAKKGVEACERHINGEISDEELAKAFFHSELTIPYGSDPDEHRDELSAHYAARAVEWCLGLNDFGEPCDYAPLPSHVAGRICSALNYTFVDWTGGYLENENPAKLEVSHQIAIVHDIIGNPFHPVDLSSTLRTRTVLQIAQLIYDQRDYHDMPVLGDALEDAGCDQQAILEHCRAPVAHARGCWVLDLLLRKEEG